MQFHLLRNSSKRIGIGIFLCLSVNVTTAQIKWDGGGGDGLWGTAANWVGDVIPVNTDNVLLDNSIVPGSYTVTLPGGSVITTVSTLIITPSTGNTITLLLPSSNTAIPGLAITGAGDAIVLNNGAVFQNSSGVASGSTFDITSTFRINNGGHYIHNNNGTNAAIASQLSSAAGTERGIFEYKSPSVSLISAPSRIYGTLILNTVGGTKNYSILSGTNPLTIRGDFIVNSNVNLKSSAVSNIIVNGNLQQFFPSTIDLSSSVNSPQLQVKGDVQLQGILTESGTGFPILELNGTTNQNVSVTGTITNSVGFKINNPSGATLLSPITLSYTLDLTNGKIKTDATNILTLSATATVAGGSSSSFVEGPMKKIGNTSFTFPIGIGSIYAPLTITNVSGEAITDEFTSEYKRQNPQSSIGSAVVSGLDHVSYVEYWSLQQNVGSATKKISLQVTPQSFSKMMANTYVSRYNGSQWTNEGSIITSGPFVSGSYEMGTIQSVNTLSGFGSFTLATDKPFTDNPLPVKLISFSAVRNAQTRVVVNWQLAETNLLGSQFVLQRAINNTDYKDIATIHGGLTDAYQFIDNINTEGFINYRLKMTDANGAVGYSKIAVVSGEKQGLLLSIRSNILSYSSATIDIKSVKSQPIQLMLIDMQGRVIQQWYEQVNTGTNRFNLSLVKLLPGAYYLIASDSDGNKATGKFIRQ